MTDLVEAARYEHRVQADLAQLYLGSEGIEAVLFDTGMNSFYGILGALLFPVRLMVRQEDLAAARLLLAKP